VVRPNSAGGRDVVTLNSEMASTEGASFFIKGRSVFGACLA